MDHENPALDALRKIDADRTQPGQASLPHIVNGIKTCGPLFAAALSFDTTEIDKDIDEMLDATKSLIENVKEILFQKNIGITDFESSAINAFCIRVVAENWKSSQEVFDTLVNPVVASLEEQGLSAELDTREMQTHAGEEVSANIIVTGEIFSILHGCTFLKIESNTCSICLKEVLKASKRAIEKLTQFHIPYEDAEAVSGHITMQAGKVFSSILKREIRLYQENQRYSAMTESTNKEPFSFDNVFRSYHTAMNGFVDAIYANSRMVS